MLGCLGGVNWAILVAFVVQRYPNASPAVLLHKFFLMYHRWKWPNHVSLNELQSLKVCGFVFMLRDVCVRAVEARMRLRRFVMLLLV